jgi:hypothetical protein
MKRTIALILLVVTLAACSSEKKSVEDQGKSVLQSTCVVDGRAQTSLWGIVIRDIFGSPGSWELHVYSLDDKSYPNHNDSVYMFEFHGKFKNPTNAETGIVAFIVDIKKKTVIEVYTLAANAAINDIIEIENWFRNSKFYDDDRYSDGGSQYISAEFYAKSFFPNG